MSWAIQNDTLFKGAEEIGYFLPTANEKERRMIKNGDDLMCLVGEFVESYDEGKMPLKSLVNRLIKIVDIQAKYIMTWQVSREAELLNEYDNVIFIFVKQNSMFTSTIKHLPEVYLCLQNLLNNLNSTAKHEMKKLYNRLCDIYDKILEA